VASEKKDSRPAVDQGFTHAQDNYGYCLADSIGSRWIYEAQYIPSHRRDVTVHHWMNRQPETFTTVSGQRGKAETITEARRHWQPRAFVVDHNLAIQEKASEAPEEQMNPPIFEALLPDGAWECNCRSR
jgi:hypothetical protein